MIRIYPPAYWDLLQIRRNKTLYVEESTSVMISRDILEVTNSIRNCVHKPSHINALFIQLDCASKYFAW